MSLELKKIIKISLSLNKIHRYKLSEIFKVLMISGLTLSLPLFMYSVLKQMKETFSLINLIYLFFFWFLVLIITVLIEFQSHFYQEKYSLNLQKSLLNKVTKHYLQRYNYNKLTDLDGSKIAHNIDQDFTDLLSISPAELIQIFVQVIRIIISLIIILFVKWELTVLILFFSFLYVINFSFWRERIKLVHKLQKKSRTNYLSIFSEFISNIHLVFTYKLFTQEYLRIKSSFEKHIETMKSKEKTFLKYQLTHKIISQFLPMFLLFVTMIGVYYNYFDWAEIVVSWGLISISMTSFGQLSGVRHKFSVGVDSWNKNKFYFCSKDLEKNEDVRLPFKSLIIKDINFSYPLGKKIFSNLSFELRTNNIYLIKGKNGVGKSTLCKLLMGYLKADSGEFILNGEYVTSKILYNSNIFSIIEQHNVVYQMTFKENILLGRKFVPKKWEEINKLTSLNTNQVLFDKVLNKNSSNISGGQMQKLLLARGLYDLNQVIIFDEPLNALDALSRKDFLKLIEKLKSENKTIIIISHQNINLKGIITFEL